MARSLLQGLCTPNAGFPPHEKTKSNRGDPALQLSQVRRHCKSKLLDILISPYISQFMGCVIGRIHYGLKVVLWFRHFTVSNYLHIARLLTSVDSNFIWPNMTKCMGPSVRINCWNAVQCIWSLTHPPPPLEKMLAISQTIFQMHFREWKLLYFDWNYTEFSS